MFFSHKNAHSLTQRAFIVLAMPPKPRYGKTKKLLEIEDRDLRQQLMRRSLQAPPLPTSHAGSSGLSSSQVASPSTPVVGPSTPASSAPHIMAPGSSAPNPVGSSPCAQLTALQLSAPPLPAFALATSSDHNTGSASTGASTTTRNIRCKNLVTRDTPPKRKRGVVVGLKTQQLVRTTGGNIAVEYDNYHRGLKDPAVRSLISRDIGSCVKDTVPMMKATYRDIAVCQEQIDVIVTRLGDKRGTNVRGVGMCMQREPKKRGGARRVEVDSIVDERVSEVIEELMADYREKEAQLEERIRQSEERHRQREAAQEERLRQMDEKIAMLIGLSQSGV